MNIPIESEDEDDVGLPCDPYSDKYLNKADQCNKNKKSWFFVSRKVRQATDNFRAIFITNDTVEVSFFTFGILSKQNSVVYTELL
jgi:hypothetical protein